MKQQQGHTYLKLKSRGIKAWWSAAGVSPVAEQAAAPGAPGVSTGAVTSVTLPERWVYSQDENKQVNQPLKLVLQLWSSHEVAVEFTMTF